MNLTIVSYIFYITISVLITVWVGWTLYRGGRYFLVEIFIDENIADAINRLLLIGFYLVNIAYVLLIVKEDQSIDQLSQVIEVISRKTGMIVSILAVMHFFNLTVFTIWKKWKLRKEVI